MTYEFNANDSDLNNFPNPFQIENVFLFLSSLSLIISGFFVLVTAKQYIQVNEMKVAGVTVALAMVLFTAGVKFAIQALSQVRFYLGRGMPKGLASELPINQTGAGLGTNKIIKSIREQSIDFAEPAGPLNGVLYSLIGNLITSPPPIQAAAVQHFHGLLMMLSMLVSLVVSYFLFGGTPHEGLISWFYLPLTGLSLITPFMQYQSIETSPNSSSLLWKMIFLVAFSVMAPVIIPKYLPAYPIPPMWIAPAVLLVGSMVASVFFLASLVSKMDSATQTSVSCSQQTLGMNCPPSQMWTEINREFQNNWHKGIPNRPYANVPPEVGSEARGSFTGFILEESQPEPKVTLGFGSLSDALQHTYSRYLILLTFWGFILVSISAAFAPFLALQFIDISKFEISRSILIIISLNVSATLSFKIAHLLWSRMHFKSRLFWVETQGTFQQSEISVGNQFTGNANSKSLLTRVEDATLRVWVTDIVSVAFGKSSERYIISLAPADNVANTIAQRLREFTLNQSSIAAPTSGRDVENANKVAQLNALMSAAITTQSSLQLGTSPSVGKVRGRIKFFNEEKQFGFITGEDGVDRYFRGDDLTSNERIDKERIYSFTSKKSARGHRALNLTLE